MPRVSEAHREAMRQRIQNAALDVVRRKGIASTTMADIITAAGLSAGAIYGYYASKTDLMSDIARSVLVNRVGKFAELAARRPVPSPAEALHEHCLSVPEALLRGGVILQFWAGTQAEEHPDQVAAEFGREVRQAHIAYLTAWFAQGGLHDAAAAVAAQRCAPAFMALTQGVVVYAALSGSEGVQTYADAVARVIDGELAARTSS